MKGASRDNNFGLLRLLFAVLVIVSHSTRLIDGNRSRELLTRLFGTMSFGEVAVDGFFIISGFLITKSFVESPTLSSYLLKRVFRIYPGYLVSYWLCLVVLAPLVGGHNPALSFHWIGQNILFAALLQIPASPGAFHGLTDPILNGSMWTIVYEFRCYLLAALLGLIGCYGPKARVVIVIFGAGLMVLNVSHSLDPFNIRHEWLFGAPASTARLCAAFAVGQAFYLFRERIRYGHRGALLACAILLPLMFSARLAETAFMCLGGYLIFWFAFKVPVLALSKADNKADISYGVYLYAMPIQNLLVWSHPSITPWALFWSALCTASLFGAASWVLVERPSLAFVRRTRKVPGSVPESPAERLRRAPDL